MSVLAGCQVESNPTEYTLIFNANGGEGSIGSITKEENEEIALPTEGFTKDGYEFSGWNTAADGSGRAYTGGDKFKFTADTVLYAQWKKTETPQNPDTGSPKISYTITFNSNGGSGEMNALTAESGTEITLTANAFTREGYTFSGWATSADGNIVHKDEAKIKLTENITLYAQWTEIGKVEKVTFSATGDVDYNEKITLSCGMEGATIYYLLVAGTDAPTAEEFSSSKQKYSEPLAITENAVIAAIAVKDGLKDSEMATASFTVKTYAVTFVTEYGTAPTKIEGLKKGDKLGDRLPELTAEGYRFDGWFDGETQFSAETEITSSLTLTAKWTKTYTVTFDANGGTGSIASITEVAGTEIGLPENAFTKDGYIFTGWATSADGDILYADKAKITLTGDITIYAQWGMTAANAAATIANLTEEATHTVTVAGEISAEELTELTKAISGLAENVKVILDLGGATGLTDIPAEFNLENLAGIVIPASVTKLSCLFWESFSLSVLKVAENNPAYKSVDNIIYTKDGQTLVLAAKNLTEVTIPSGVKTIGSNAFRQNFGLKKVVFEEASVLETIEEFAFDCCNELTEITLPSTLRTLGEGIFNCCLELKSITLPEGIKTIPTMTFTNCTSFTEISLPSTLESIETWTFGNTKLSIVKYNGTKSGWGNIQKGNNNDDLLNATIICTDGSITDPVSLIKRLGEGEHTVTVTGDVSAEYLAEIADAIYNKHSVTKIILDLSGATGLTEIPDFAFYKEERGSYYALAGIVLPQGITSIGESAFQYTSLSEIVIPDSVTEIGISAFSDTPLKSVKIGVKVAKIGNLAFCSTALTSIEIPDSVTSVGTQIFQTCYSLKDVTIGKGLTSISNSMFVLCSALEEIVISEGVKSIERRAFDSCEKLESITIPVSVTLIEEYAFDCTSLADVYYGGTVAEWNALKDDGKISSTGNDALFNATIHCTDDDYTGE